MYNFYILCCLIYIWVWSPRRLHPFYAMPQVTFYIAENEKKRLNEVAEAKGVTCGKLASSIVRAWVQNRMPED